MLLTKEVEVQLNSSNFKYYSDLGYEIIKIKDKIGRYRTPKGTTIIVKIEDLPNNSNMKVDIKCDCEDCKSPYLKPMTWQNYLKHIKENGNYYCKYCIMKLFTGKTRKKNKLENGKSFKQWCINNNRQDILDRWDYKLNDCKPEDITYGDNKNYYFKCPRGLHKSELKNIVAFTKRQKDSMNCNQCNSFAQWGIDNLGKDFLEKYWDYKNNIVNPWNIASQYNKKVFIICQEKDYHDSYDISCAHFVKGTRCSYCANMKVHKFDSLGYLFPDSLIFWSDKNNKSPYDYPPGTQKEVLWECPNKEHEDFFRSIRNSKRCEFRCPECQFSKGEKKIEEYLNDNSFINIKQEEYDKLNDFDKFKNNYYIPQKEFDGLLGLGNGNLSYDFYLPNLQYNLLIEYQGEFHDGNNRKQTKEDKKRQKEHDRRKKNYALNNKYNFLEIWYWDYDNVEKILEKELIKIEKKDLEVG